MQSAVPDESEIGGAERDEHSVGQVRDRSAVRGARRDSLIRLSSSVGPLRGLTLSTFTAAMYVR